MYIYIYIYIQIFIYIYLYGKSLSFINKSYFTTFFANCILIMLTLTKETTVITILLYKNVVVYNTYSSKPYV